MTEYAPKIGWYSPWTQKIANDLPSWNVIRLQRDSVGQQVINAGAGRHMEHAWNEADRALLNKFPSTMDINQPDLVAKVELDRRVPLDEPVRIRNYLLNSSFEIWPNQSALPQMWRHTGDGSVTVVSTGFVGNRALALQTGSGQSIAVYQDFTKSIPANQEWSFSCWYSCRSSAGLPPPLTGFGLEAIGYCVDDTTETLRVAFTGNTNGYPKKASVTGSFTKAVSVVRVRAVVTNDVAFPFTDPVVVDMFQAEPGSVASAWRPHPYDNWPHVRIIHDISPVLSESGNRAQFVEDEADFWYWAVPTRVAPLVGIQEYNATQDDAPSADANGVTVYGTAGRWLEVDHEGNEWPYQVLAYAYGGEHKLRMVGTEVPDILGTFDLAFRNYRSYFEVDTDITLEAITWFGHWLWVVHRKNDLAGTNRRYLSVVDVNTPWPRPSYLEVMATLELEGLSVHDRITRVEFRHGDQQHVYIGDGLNTYVYSLYYDYFVVKGRTLYFREKPDRVSIVYPESARQVRTREEDASKMDRTHRRN